MTDQHGTFVWLHAVASRPSAARRLIDSTQRLSPFSALHRVCVPEIDSRSNHTNVESVDSQSLFDLATWMSIIFCHLVIQGER